MWIAHGFVRGKYGEQTEDTGSRYFNDLVERSFFQLSTSREAYTMHDLFHDLAQSISGNECFNAKDSEQRHRIPRKARHLSLKLSGPANFERIYQLRSLRTLLFRGNCSWTNEMRNSLKFLRALELKGCDMPNFIGSLRHLRYLKFENSITEVLPESLCSIYNLQTLILSHCYQLTKLPCEMCKLINLRHLELNDCLSLESMTLGIGRLTGLQTLSKFIVSREEERGIEELKNLTDLRGSLEVRNLEQVEKVEAAQQANLKSKRFIDGLQLIWSDRELASSINERLEEEVAEELRPHPNVKKLQFCGYMGARFPSWMMKRGMDMLLPNLTYVYLNGCRKCNILPPLGQLPFLVSLFIGNMNEVKQIAEGQFPRLKHLKIRNCPQLPSLPAFSSLEKLRLIGLDNLEDWCGVEEADFQNLHALVVKKCPKLLKWPTNLASLSKLVVSDSWGLDSFPLLPSLLYLEVGECSDKLWNSVSSLTSLSTLTLTSQRLTTVPRGILRTLNQLRKLLIKGCYKLETLLEEDDVPLTLTHLIIVNCRNLKSLPRGLRALAPLQQLMIHYCPEVVSLPEEGLPNGLQSLSILGCPELEKRCRKDTGEDWLKISRIPHLHVGYPED